uniref:Uncharacterized protein n=1 Tax=Palpitomonas bilix TaxID=652834 RepID=A0A7S3G4Q3_9EUKA|mmetsp:Transcript_26164/g.66483  ORF Transcript_26164/g.66483 Transcript_26164/m.66483 type:complete len:945 (+) Transcript_26164:378-3212(+)
MEGGDAIRSQEETRKTKTNELVRVLDGNGGGILDAFKDSRPDSLSSLLNTQPIREEKDSQGRNVLHYLASNTSPGVDALIRQYVQRQGDASPVNELDEKGFSPLHVAAAYGSSTNVKSLLELGAAVNVKTKDECTPLWFACFANHPDCAELLLLKGAEVEGYSQEPCLYVAACVGSTRLCDLLVQRGADVNCREAIGMTPVIGASENGHADALSYLLASGGRATDRDERGNSALMKACMNCHTSCVRLLLANGADVKESPSEDEVKRADKGEHPCRGLLTFPCGKDNVELVRLLLEHGANPEGVHPTEFPLMLASGRNHLEVCKALVAAGANVNRVAVGQLAGATALLSALEKSYLEVASFLLEKGADINFEGKYGNAMTKAALTGVFETVQFVVDHGGKCLDGPGHPLVAAVKKGNLRMVRYLLENVVKVEELKGVFHPFTVACAEGNREIIDLLLEYGVDPNVEALGGQNALFKAASRGDIDLISKLLELGANVDGQEGDGLPLAIAAQENRFAAVKLLLSKGAKINVEARPLILAIDKGYTDIALYLIEAGADPNYPCKGGQGALWKAAYNGRIAIVKALLSKGARVEGQREAAAPIIVAAQNGHVEVIKALVEAGADVNSEAKMTTALEVAVRNDRYECVKYLLEKGAKSVAPSQGLPLTPLDLAFLMNAVREEIIVLLLRHGANVCDSIPLMCRAAKKSAKAVQLLQREGVDLKVTDDDGDTPLHFAAMGNSKADVIRYLAEQGCDLEAKNKKGMTPLFVAVVKKDAENVATLFEVGADPSSLQTKVGNHSPAEICARNTKLGHLLSHAISPAGVSHRASVLSKRREAMRAGRNRQQGHSASVRSDAVPAPSVASTEANPVDASSFESWSNTEVAAWARSIKLHAEAVSLIERSTDFDGTFLSEATFEDLVDFLKMTPISARRLIKGRDNLLRFSVVDN